MGNKARNVLGVKQSTRVNGSTLMPPKLLMTRLINADCVEIAKPHAICNANPAREGSDWWYTANMAQQAVNVKMITLRHSNLAVPKMVAIM
mmetsp:Transcript_58134/g.162989  ORF Transcript_58134/g.162989 Transcript_58134/m.162989 type:complete len:91 (-) Transcript_58134:558-830(-)